jgi:hypothetical protein
VSFHCPRCDAKTTVMSTRAELRQRKCIGCDYLFRTEEVELESQSPKPRARLSYPKKRQSPKHKSDKRWSEDKITQLKDMLLVRRPFPEIASALGVSRSAAIAKAWRLGI